MADLAALTQALVAGDQAEVINLVQRALTQGLNAHAILNEGLIRGMDQVGAKMEEGEMFIPEVLQRAHIMSSALEVLKPHLGEGSAAFNGKVVFGTVKGDLHDIGKNLVILMMRSSGFNVVDLGVDVTAQAFVEAAKKHGADIVALSALLTTTMAVMDKTVAALKAEGLKDRVKVIIGGAPVSQKFADQIGADGYAADAGSACKLAKSLLS
ncbi:MAG: corrinoid protein [Thermodesulfobacteriota bacterium]